MEEVKLGVIEKKFADIIWEKEPLTSGELVRICAMELEWKKSTTYTVLKKLCERGLFMNENGVVKALVSKEEFQAMKSENIVDESFGGSLPAFIAAFTQKRQLSREEIEEIHRMIDSIGGK